MSPNDFYAGVSAAFVVILFTKFLTHRMRRPEFQSKDSEDLAWWIGHWICVIAAWLGLLLSLAVLAIPAYTDHDGGARWATGAAAHDRRNDPCPGCRDPIPAGATTAAGDRPSSACGGC